MKFRYALALLLFSALPILGGEAEPPKAREPAAKPAKRPVFHQSEPLVVISLAGYDALLRDADALAKIGHQPAIPTLLRAMIDEATDKKGIAGLDGKRPWGMTLRIDAGGTEAPVLVFLPVTDLNAFLQSLAPDLGPPTETDGVYEVPLGGDTWYAKQQGNWAFASTSRGELAELPKEPEKILGDLPRRYLLAAEVRVGNIPSMIRESLKMLEEIGMLERDVGESERRFAARKAALSWSIQQAQAVLADIETITAGVRLDAAAESLIGEMEIAARPDSATAKLLARSTEVRMSGFLLPQSLLAGHCTMRLSASDGFRLHEMLNLYGQDTLAAIRQSEELTPDQKKVFETAINDILGSLLKTVSNGAIHLGMSLEITPESSTGAMGLAVAQGPRVNKAIAAILERLGKDEPEVFQKVAIDARQYKGVHFHRFTLALEPLDAPEDFRQFFDKSFGRPLAVVIGVGDEAVYLAFGKRAEETLVAAIDGERKDAPPLALFLAGTPYARMGAAYATDDEKAVATEAAKILEASKGKDRIQVTGQVIPNGMRFQMVVEPGVLKLLQLVPIPGIDLSAPK